jgi:hypothetical protein
VWSGWSGNVRHTLVNTRNIRARSVETEAQREQRLENERHRRLRDEENLRKEAAERKLAEEKAKKLLEECLTPVQKRAFRRWGVIPVVAKSGKFYRIETGRQGNIVEMEKRKAVARYCVHPGRDPRGGIVPTFDVMLAQKLLIETDEKRFLKLANKTRIAA